MEFKEAMQIYDRICEENDKCEKCVLNGHCPWNGECDYSETETILAKWAAEHPEKTIADDFFEKHPKALRKKDGAPMACALHLGYCLECRSIGGGENVCHDCWQRPLEEVE